MTVVAAFGVLSLIGACAVFAQHMYTLSSRRTAVFGPARRAYQVVRFPNLTHPVRVHEMILDVPQVPVFSKFCEELPVGMGIKGGIARKILKIMLGVSKDAPYMKSEIGGDYDIDVVVLVEKTEKKKEMETFIRKDLSGILIGGLVLEPKDIETVANVSDYFLSRDITQNEILLFRNSENCVTLYFTEEAQFDCQNGIVRSSAHTLSAHYTNVWMCDDETGIPVFSERGLLRAVVRMLKGHGIQYAIPDATWEYYKRKKLTPIAVFKVLRNFESNKDNFERAYQHLIDLGVVEPGTKAIDVWGEALRLLNHKMSRYGLKFNMAPQSSEEVDLWCDRKKADVNEWLRGRRANALKTGFLESDEEAEIMLPDSLVNFSSFMYSCDHLTSFYPDKHKDDPISGLPVEQAVAKFMRSQTLRRISDSFAEFLENSKGVEKSSARSGRRFSTHPIILVDRPRLDVGRIAAMNSKAFEKSRDVHIDPVPTKVFISQAARILKLLNSDWPYMIVGLGFLFGRLLLAIYLPYPLCLVWFEGGKKYLEGLIIESFLQNDITKLQADVAQLAALTAAEIALFFLSSFVLQLLSLRVMTVFTKHLFSYMLQENLHSKKMRTGDKMARINDAMALKTVFSSDFPLLVEGALHAIGSICASFILHPWLGVVTACAAFTVFVFTLVFGFIGRHRSSEIRTVAAKLYRASYECFAHIRGVYSLGTERTEITSYQWLVESLYAQIRTLSGFYAFFYSYTSSMSMGCRLALLWVSVGFVLRGTVSPGDVMTQLFLAEMAMLGVSVFFQAYGNLLSVIGATQRLFHLLSEPTTDMEGVIFPSAGLSQPTSSRLEFSATIPLRVDFTPLEKVTFTAYPGKILAITGKANFDKSGIVQVLRRDYKPDDAVMTLGGVDIYSLELCWYRKQVAVFEQDVELFTGSVAYNIAYGCEKVTMKQVVQAAQIAGAHSFISTLQDGYMTSVGENGTHLSSTQKLKLALARMLLRAPRIAVFDIDYAVESETDVEFRTRVLEVVAKMAKRAKLAVIVLTHHPRVMEMADVVCCVG